MIIFDINKAGYTRNGLPVQLNLINGIGMLTGRFLLSREKIQMR